MAAKLIAVEVACRVLVTNALGMAIDTRTPLAGTIIHSDQGTLRAKTSGCWLRWAAAGTAMTTR